ncbi:cytochrome P450 [Epithele typhae]|uniref:cytochrome P450 n=1 Tax=Epithele typhae TaxID=378194 RepID=UPI0020084F62|nr:cytochrome P450 [Epithele typhae]KAH9914908.1 cytochrome P450 [Epithele typhae]
MDYIHENTRMVVCGTGAAIVATVVLRWLFDPLRRIPTVGGPSIPLLSYIGAFNFIRDAMRIITEGYQKHHGSVFKVALFDQWMVVISGRRWSKTSAKDPRTRCHSSKESKRYYDDPQILQTKHTIGRAWLDDPYLVDITREKLTRTLPAVMPDIVEELMLAVPENVPAPQKVRYSPCVTYAEWVSVHVINSMRKIVARVSNRVFVGFPACRNEEFLDLMIRYTFDITSDNDRMKPFPGFLKGVVGGLMSNTRKTQRRATAILDPIIKERLDKLKELGDGWTEKPNNLLTWILEKALLRDSTAEQITQRVLLANFAAIQTTSKSATHAIYHLAAAPALADVLRAEVEPIVAAEGWSKAALGKMWKVDSLLRESQRMNGISLLAATRKALKDITLADGTFIPAGTLVNAAAYPAHRESSVYGATADEFDPWRFSRMREGAGEDLKHQYVNTSPEYLAFGHGRHACPGRFFAGGELKALIAVLVLNYDMKIPGDGPRPSNVHFAEHVLPDLTAHVLFRKRQPARA